MTADERPRAGMPLRVAHLVRAIFPQHGYGGLERAATALTTHMLRQGADVTLFTRAYPPQRVEWQVRAFPLEIDPATGSQNSKFKIQNSKLAAVGIPYSLLPLRPNGIAARLTNYPLFVERMGRAVGNRARAGALDAVYAHGLAAFGVRQRARRRTPHGVAPLLMNPHGLEDFKVRQPLKRLAYAPFRAMYARGAQAADRVVATDESLRAEVVRFLRVPPERVVVLPNGVDPQAGAAWVDPAHGAVLRARYGLAPGLRVGLSVARLEANKGLPYLLRALAAVEGPEPARSGAGAGRSWRWVLVGSGRDRAALEGLARELGLAGHVVFAGAVSEADLHNLYALADVFAIASLYEGSSLATLEAMAHGLPVVATATGGLPDKVLPGRTGLLVPPADAPALAGAITALLADPALAAGMGAAGAALVRERFTWAAITTQTLCLLEGLVQSSR